MGSCTKQKKLEGLWTLQSINNESVADYFIEPYPAIHNLEFLENLTFILSKTYLMTDTNLYIIIMEGDYTFRRNEVNLISSDSITNSRTLSDVKLKRNELRCFEIGGDVGYEYYFTK